MKKLKPIKKYISTKKGISQRTYYIKNERFYSFQTYKNGKKDGKLNTSARSVMEAKKKASAWVKWAKRKGFGNYKLKYLGLVK